MKNNISVENWKKSSMWLYLIDFKENNTVPLINLKSSHGFGKKNVLHNSYNVNYRWLKFSDDLSKQVITFELLPSQKSILSFPHLELILYKNLSGFWYLVLTQYIWLTSVSVLKVSQCVFLWLLD